MSDTQESNTEETKDVPIEEIDWKSKESELEELFKHRYTDDDPQYVKTVNRDFPEQPCVYPWYVRENRNRNSYGGGRPSWGRSNYNSRYSSDRDSRYGSDHRNMNYHDRNASSYQPRRRDY